VWALGLALGAAFLFCFALFAMLIAVSFIDIRYFIIPTVFSLYAVPYAIAGHLGLQQLGYTAALDWRAAVLGASLGGGILLIITLFWKVVLRYEGMGLGDVKLLALIGAFVGPFPGAFFVMAVAAMAGVIVGVPLGVIDRRGLRYAMPFGPFLAFSAILWLLHGPELTMRYFPAAALIKDLSLFQF